MSRYFAIVLYFLSMGNNNNNYRIKNNDLPVCSQCIHYQPPPHHLLLYGDSSTIVGRCKLFGTKDIVTGHVDYTYADICRMNSMNCGMNGTLFEPK
jgi:hypothetical protein